MPSITESPAPDDLGGLLLNAAERWPRRDALVFPDSRQTYAELVDGAFERARSLTAFGIAPGDHLGILMPNCPEYIELLFGAALVGAVAVPVNARYKAEDAVYH